MQAHSQDNLEKFWNYEKNVEIVSEISISSHKEAYFICENNHEWINTVFNQSRIKNCQECQKLYFKFPHLREQWDFEKNTVDFESVFTTISTKIYWKCPDCLGTSKSSIVKKIQQKRCSFCANKKLLIGFNDLATAYPELLDEWDYKKNKISPSEILSNSGVVVWWNCRFEHSFKTALRNKTLRGFKCRQCRISKDPEIVKVNLYEKHKIDKEWILRNYVNSSLSIDEIYREFGISPSVIKRALTAYGLRKDEEIILKHKNSKRSQTNFEKYGNSHPWAFAVSPSTYEIEIYKLLTEEFGLEVVQNDRKVIAPKELDLWIPSKKTAIEFNGNYWHDKNLWLKDVENNTAVSPEAQKSELCKNSGIKLFHIWEDDWLTLTTKVDKIAMMSKMLAE